MSARVTDKMVLGFLVWARNYGEIESFEKLPVAGRCWKIVMPGVVRAHGGSDPLLGGSLRDDPMRTVPTEFVLTAREALVFGYGIAAGGARERRAEFAAREWGWDSPTTPARVT